jgi:hypothetical protein
MIVQGIDAQVGLSTQLRHASAHHSRSVELQMQEEGAAHGSSFYRPPLGQLVVSA